MADPTMALQVLLDDPDKIQDPVAILHWGKSGSHLLCSLLDGHAQVLQNPFEAMFSYHYREGELFARSTDGRVSHAEVLRWADAHYDAIAGSREPALAARTAFLGFLGQILSRRGGAISRPTLIKAVHVAYAAARGHPLVTTRPALIWNLHVLPSPEMPSLELLKSLYPRLRFITTVRFPEKALDSELHAFCLQGQQNIDSPKVVRSTLVQIFQRDKPLAMDHVGVRFEDMHCEPEATTRALATWIGIDWQPCLMESSIDGERYYFPGQYVHTALDNDPHGVTGFSPKRARDRSFSILSPIDRFLMKLVLRRHYVDWGYGDEATTCLAPLRAWILGVMAWLPIRAQRTMLARDLALAVRKGSRHALPGVVRRYLGEIGPTAKLLRQKGRSKASVFPILQPGNRGARTE